MKIVTLIENTCQREGLLPEHGLSLYIETGDHKILFDAGQTGAFADNAEKMGIDPKDMIVVSVMPCTAKKFEAERLDHTAVPGLADIDAAIADIKAIITSFWASKITNVKSLPFRIGQEEDGLPGAYQSSTGYIWESPMYLLTEETSTLRFTVFSTNTPDKKFGDWVYFTLGEFELFDLYGNKIELTEESFDANSIDPADGSGFAGLCDGKTDTWFHAVYANSEGHNPKAFEAIVNSVK